MTQPKRPILNPAIYARVSTSDQNCQLQLSELREWVARMGWPKATEYVDHGFSGAKASRPDFDRLMKAALAHDHDCVLVWKIDRFGRSVLNLSQHLAALDAAGVRFVATSQGLDTDSANPASRLLLSILAAIAEFERELILERSAVGRNKKLEAGRPDSWNLGFGFAVEGDAPRIVEKEAEVVRQIFRWRQEGKSYRNIAGLLQILGVKPRKAAYWSPATIRGMLQNTVYAGEFQRCGHIWAVPAIIPRDVFDDVQRKMRAVYQRLVGRPSGKYLLRGLVFCRCSRRMHGTECHTGGGGKWRHYRCDGKHHRNPSLRAPCSAPRVSARVLEALVWSQIWELLCDPARVRRLAEAMVAEEKRARGAAGLKRDPARELEAVCAELKRIQRMVQKGTYDEDEGAAEATKLRREIATLEAEIRALGKVFEIAPLDAVEWACRAIAAGPEPDGYEDRREVLEGLLDLQVRVDGEEATITGKIPVPAAEVAAPQKNRKEHLGVAGSELCVRHFSRDSFCGRWPAAQWQWQGEREGVCCSKC